mgnify:CR=1 FL=1
MNQAQEVRCPNCGAPVPQGAFSQRAVACNYCGTTLALHGGAPQPGAGGGGPHAGADAPYGVSLTGWMLVLEHAGDNLINTIREVRGIANCSLLDAKNAVDRVPSQVPIVAPGVTRADIEKRFKGCRYHLRRT